MDYEEFAQGGYWARYMYDSEVRLCVGEYWELCKEKEWRLDAEWRVNNTPGATAAERQRASDGLRDCDERIDCIRRQVSRACYVAAAEEERPGAKRVVRHWPRGLRYWEGRGIDVLSGPGKFPPDSCNHD